MRLVFLIPRQEKNQCFYYPTKKSSKNPVKNHNWISPEYGLHEIQVKTNSKVWIFVFFFCAYLAIVLMNIHLPLEVGPLVENNIDSEFHDKEVYDELELT